MCYLEVSLCEDTDNLPAESKLKDTCIKKRGERIGLRNTPFHAFGSFPDRDRL